MLTVGAALVIGSTLVLVSLLTALGVAQRWPRHALELREEEEEGQQQRFDFGGMVPTAAGEPMATDKKVSSTPGQSREPRWVTYLTGTVGTLIGLVPLYPLLSAVLA